MTIDNFELNAGDDFIIALDVSASMDVKDCPGGLTRFDYALEKVKVFAHEAAKYDTDGVSIYRFGSDITKFPDITEDKIDLVIGGQPPTQCATLTHEAIQQAYAEHVERRNDQTFLLIITDGQPSNEAAVFSVIAEITHQIKDEKEFRIQFLTVGKQTIALIDFLRKLDDALPGAKYDIVDVKELDKVNFYAAVEGALNY